MPKDKSSRSSFCKREKSHPYMHDSGYGKEYLDSSMEKNDWEDAICPICMDFPHNAVLLLCTSHDKGCRPFMCNSSHRHSNCLDQYRKFQLGNTFGPQDSPSEAGIDLRRNLSTSGANEVDENVGVQIFDRELALADSYDHMQQFDARDIMSSSPPSNGDIKGLVCPLCRGKVTGWTVVGAARDHLNLKPRCCARESCSFTGTYAELRAHARSEHPLARPSEIDPARQQDWRRLERQRDLGDVLSTIRSALPGATVLGDYVIEDGLGNENGDGELAGGDGHWWTVFLLFQVFGPATYMDRRHFRSRIRSRIRRHHQGPSARNVLWGENLLWDGNADAGSLSGSSDANHWSQGTPQRRHGQRRSEDSH